MSRSLDAQQILAVLEALPVGISATANTGEALFANTAARLHRMADPATGQRNIVVQKFEPFPGVVVELSTDVTEQRRLEDDLFRRAYFDSLTGLPNRSLFEASIDALVRSAPAEFALAFIDLDGFKHINDYYGHLAGDVLLLKVAERVNSGLTGADMLARVGGDEFLLLLAARPEESFEQCFAALAERLRDPFFVEGHEIFASASIGVSLYPRDGGDFDALSQNADKAMYRVKGGHKGSVQFFAPSIGHAAGERHRTEQRLRLAVRDGRICCAYQPKVDLRTREVAGVEVLLRWRDEEGLIQPPGDFVNLAVELGLMDEITHLVLAEVLEARGRIDDTFGASVSISINVAAKQAEQPVFMRSLLEVIATTGIAERFMIELTEEAFLSKNGFQETVLPMVRRIGAKVSIDDFGVGYSSLASLADITADEIKVDRSFITSIHQRPRSQSILRAIESLARSLGMSVVVEGVETFEELAYLQTASNIRLAQGFYFAKPMFLDELAGSGTPVTDNRATAQPARTPFVRDVAGRR